MPIKFQFVYKRILLITICKQTSFCYIKKQYYNIYLLLCAIIYFVIMTKCCIFAPLRLQNDI